MQSLTACCQAKSLVSIRRRDVDDYGIQGFLVGISDDLLALEYVYDFQIDGLMILRRSDITEVKRTATDEFQERLLKREGVRPGTQQPVQFELASWQCAIEQLSKHYPLMILERELGPSPEFVIGKPLRTTKAQVEFHTFTGVGQWSDKKVRLKYSQMTCLQVNTRYMAFYQRHFERSGMCLQHD
ncbi:hypothetical protein [Acidovorax sp. sic0104]|uniref:hypothetical protein n=1 Tax=Acidovorax sp. sic0104 TaxID=2854784 RepID=UPI001C43A086|nr:hypothetical protein [Acidovorax sp. sic0104]MBV7540311.1 hypothetical protein [Acidovorax sp. sic0104]